MPKYAVSSFGRTYLTDEEISDLPIIRIIFVVVTALVGVTTLLRVFLTLFQTKTSILRPYKLLKSNAGKTTLCYIISYMIHSVHFVDNIIRPVDYFEPKWLYQKYLISEMEITFFANFPITLSGLYFMRKLIRGVDNEKHREVATACFGMTWYILGSLLTLGHYRTEPPWQYEAFVNFTIAGEGITTIVLAILLIVLNRESKKNAARMAMFDAEDSVDLLEKTISSTAPGIRARTPVK